MKPIWRKAAVGTPAKQPIAVAVDQPPETSDDPVALEAWASMLWQRFVQVCVSVACYTRAAKWEARVQFWESVFLYAETGSKAVGVDGVH